MGEKVNVIGKIRKIGGSTFILISPKVAKELNLSDGDIVDLVIKRVYRGGERKIKTVIE